MKKIIAAVLVMMAILIGLPALTEFNAPKKRDPDPLPVKVLILPKFEVDQMYGDFPGEAQYYYGQYLMNADEYNIPNSSGDKLFYKDEVALYVLGEGKVSAAMNTMAVLSDSRFDFSDAYIISTGCAGSSVETTVMGDVFVITSCVDIDLGHHADAREIADPNGTTWFRDSDFDAKAFVRMDPQLCEKVFSLVKDTPLSTTEKTRNYMRAAFENADWAVRDPMVMRGTSLTGDNYWKGVYDHANALLAAETYQCPDPYTATEMEDTAVALAVRQMGMLEKLIVIRGSVNMDVFMLGDTPETMWADAENTTLANDENVEAADIFATAMKNNFDVGRIIIDLILNGQF